MTQWTVMQPWWLLLSALALPLLFIKSGNGLIRLPGSWPRIIPTDLHSHLSRWLPAASHRQSRLALASLLALMGLALADISSGTVAKLPERALHGRVLVMDMSHDESFALQQYAARQLATRSPDIPTAIIASSANAYDVVPLTNDPDQLDRYLRVLTPELMPKAGRSLHLGIQKANLILQQARIQAGQIVLIGAGQAPVKRSAAALAQNMASGEIQSSSNVTWILLNEPPESDWEQYAKAIEASLLPADEINTLDTALLSRRDQAVLASTPIDQRKQLTPLFVAACLPLWLMVFFRRQAL